MNKLRRFNTVLLVVLALVLVLAIAVACGGNDEPNTPETPKKDITGITFSDATVPYDGQEHEITVSGTIPQGVTVKYTNNKGTETGTYNATATLTGEEYKTLTLTATLTIVGADIDTTGITFANATVPYDKQPHSIAITGDLPAGINVTYTYDGQAVNGVSNYGEHTVVATLSGKGYNTTTLTATLTIEAKDITGVTFNGDEVTYDENEHTIDNIVGLPDGVTVISITGNKGTDAGTYHATAEIWGVGYKPATLTATLTINPAEIVGITLTSDTVEYDGNSHSLEIDGTLPKGVTVAYTYNEQPVSGAIEIDTYTVVATLSGKNHITKTLNATLTIEPRTIRGITLENASFEYDQLAHAIYVVGNVPADVTVVYYYDGVEAKSVSTVGEHEVKAVLSGEKYKTLELNAKLTITSTEELLYSAFFNGNVYFQNSLDSNKLYRVTSNGNPSKVSNDVATYFTSNSTNLYFYSDSIYRQNIKSLSGSTVSSVYSPGRATYLACDDNGNIYYAKANLIDTKHENGIYKVNINAENPTPVRLTTDKADYIAYYGGFIYYSNTSNKSKLYRISVNAVDGTGTQLTEEKVSDIIVDGGCIYYTEHSGINATICKYVISTGKVTQLCVDNGAYLTLLDGYIYYVNKDLLTSNIFGKGIYRVSVEGGTLGLGEKILEAEEGDGYYSLASDGTNLYYYKRSDKHFYRCNPSTTAEVDLMRNFTVEEESTFAFYAYAYTTSYKGEIYYVNVLDGNSLYKYNPQTQATYKVLTDAISNVYFYNDYMYYSTHVATNYALWRLDLTTPEAEPEKISSSRYEHLIFVDNYIYAARISSTYHNYIVRMDLDGQNETLLYTDKNVHVTTLYLYNGQFHFTINPAVGYKYIYTHDLNGEEKQAVNVGVNSDKFVISADKYYYYDHTSNKFMSCTFDGKNATTITSSVDISDIYEYNGVVYYTSTSKQNTGIYAYDIASNTTTQLTDKVGHAFEVFYGQLYFINLSVTYKTDYPYRSDGDGHMYTIDLSTKEVTRVA